MFVIVIALGIVFRLVNLDRKPYWHDEIFTSLRVSGYRTEEVVQQIYTGKEIRVADLYPYQKLAPERSAIDTIQRLAEEVPEHPPLYFVTARLWAQAFGSSIAAMRSLSVLMSLLLLLIVYRLCLQLFASSTVGWIAVVLMSVSPNYVRYAQEARPYGLWNVLIGLSCIALLSAVRHQKETGWATLRWAIYSITITASLYCHIFSSLVILAHGIYVLAIERFRLTKVVIGYSVASLLSLLCFTPWLWVIVKNYAALKQTTDWTKQALPLFALIQSWGVNLSRMVIAWHFRYDGWLVYLAIPILALAVLAIGVLYRQTPRRVWLFVLVLIGVPGLSLILPDVILGGQRSTNARYLSPCYLGLHLAIAYLLSIQLSAVSLNRLRIRLLQLTTALLLSGGVLTGALSAGASTWWGWSEFDVEVSQIINQSNRSLLISEMPIGMVLPLCHRLNPDVRLMLVSDPASLKLSNDSGNLFVYQPSDRLQLRLKQQGFQPELVYEFRDKSLAISLYRLASHTSTNSIAG